MTDRMESVELSLCPFCGGDNVDVVFRSVPLSKWRYTAECKSTTCGASGSVGATKTEAAENWNRRASPVGGESDTLRQLFEDHYWDSFQADKQIVMKHVNCVLDFWAASQGAFERSDIALDGQEVAGCSARKCPEPGEAGVEGSIPSRSTTPAAAQSVDIEAAVAATANSIMAIRMMVDERAEAFVRKELEALIRAVQEGST